MIIVRSPLRITLGGGGTDIPAYYQQHGEGRCLAAAIDKYVYLTIHQTFVDELIVKYSETERVEHARCVRHPIVREALCMLHIDGHGLEICSHADIPAGTGLGSSSAFTVALLKALHEYKQESTTPQQLAQEACRIEVDILEQPIGKQDQYASAFGGVAIQCYREDGEVSLIELNLRADVRERLEANLLLFYTGYQRKAAEILGVTSMPDDLAPVWMAGNAADALEDGALRDFAGYLNEQWHAKNERVPISADIADWYTCGLRHGALGGKLVGAGGGGFLLFYTEAHARLRQAMRIVGLREVPFRFDTQGTTVVCA